VDQEHLKALKQLDEWEAVINLFAKDLYAIQDAMLADAEQERLKYLSAKGQMAHKYLQMALDRPETEEG
jgi:hypothetical protein